MGPASRSGHFRDDKNFLPGLGFIHCYRSELNDLDRCTASDPTVTSECMRFIRKSFPLTKNVIFRMTHAPIRSVVII